MGKLYSVNPLTIPSAQTSVVQLLGFLLSMSSGAFRNREHLVDG